MNDGEKKEMAVEVAVPQAEEEETVNKQSTTILEQVFAKIKTPTFFLSPQSLTKLSHKIIFWFYYSAFKRF